jgi:tetratricopeptide (TPR) repeat protein
MFNALEVKTLKARYCQALSALAAGALASAAVTPLAAQTRTQDVSNVTRIMVGIFKAADKVSGVQAADAIRTRIAEDFPIKQLYVLPKTDVVNYLESSGFSVTEALSANDARALAQILRTDAYVVGSITKDAEGYRVEPQYVLTRDNSLVQPLPMFHVSKPDQAAGPVAKAFRDAHKQFADERACVNAARDNKFPEAIAAAKRGIAAYPNATLSRICLANALRAQKAPAADVLAVVDEILKIDPKSKQALTLASAIYKEQGDQEKSILALTQLLAANPGDIRLQQQVANELAGAKNPGAALPIIKAAVEANPGDPELLKNQWLIQWAAKEYKGFTSTGEELVKIDTAAATADFFTRMSVAYAVDSQPQKAAEVAARGVAKFPNNTDLVIGYADYLRRSGQNQQAIVALNKAIAANPKLPGAYLTRAQIQADLNQPDSAMVSLQSALAQGDSAVNVARYAVGLGQTIFKAAQASKDSNDYRHAINVLEFANKTNTSPEGQFLLGAASYALAGAYLQEAQAHSKAKGEQAQACRASKNAQDLLNTAMINLPAGGKFNPQTTQQLLAAGPQYSGYADQFVKAFCK